MENSQKSSKRTHIILWVLQSILALVFVWGGIMKLSQPIDKLSAMWPWTGQIPLSLVKLTGIVDLVGAVGLILPSLLRIKTKLTSFSAIAIIILMISAIVFHIIRGEASQIGANIVFAVIAVFIAWGRIYKAPIISNRINQLPV